MTKHRLLGTYAVLAFGWLSIELPLLAIAIAVIT